MEFFEISDPEDYRAKDIYTAYCATFAPNERRSETQFKNLFSQNKAKVYAVFRELANVGYVIVWDLTGFAFVEHLEIFKHFRNQNLGSEVLVKLFQEYSKLVLECEPPSAGDIAKRRFGFYERNGFQVLDEGYTQPSYDAEKHPVHLWLLGNSPVENLNQIKVEIFDTVYCK